MPALFDRLAAAAGATCDAVLGESFEYRPMARPSDVNARAASDIVRPIVSGIMMVFGAPSARAASGAVQTIGVRVEHPGHASDRPFVSLALDRLPYAPRVGDRLHRAATGTVYQVAEILPSLPGFARLDLNEIR